MVTNRFPDQSQSPRNPVLWNPEAVHTEYLELHTHLGCRPEIGNIGIYCLPGTANDLTNL